MPYNTRRKSLSLPALGIHVPSGSRVHRASISAKPVDERKAHDHQEAQNQPPTKRVKRSHSSATQASAISPTAPPVANSPTRRSSAAQPVAHAERPKSSSRHHEYTPPPSPPAGNEPFIDHDAINDDIVAGVITQLEKTGNRPHLIKELAAVLSTSHDAVHRYALPERPTSMIPQASSHQATLEDCLLTLTSSANPAALLSSRLAAYMKRSTFTSANPCPVAKELIPIHPRKVFYYLTNTPRQELPATSNDIFVPLGIEPSSVSPNGSMTTNAPQTAPSTSLMGPPAPIVKSVISPGLSNVSPPLSNASVLEEDEEGRSYAGTCEEEDHSRRRVLSPSPEVDLSLDLIHDTLEEQLDNATPNTSYKPQSTDSRQSSLESTNSSMSTSNRANLAREAAAQLEMHILPAHNPHKFVEARDLTLNRRAQSPKIERDEQEFTSMALGLRERANTSSSTSPATTAMPTPAAASENTQPTFEVTNAQQQPKHDALNPGEDETRTQLEAAQALFQNEHSPSAHFSSSPHLGMMSSPNFRPLTAIASPNFRPMSSPRARPEISVVTGAPMAKTASQNTIIGREDVIMGGMGRDGDFGMGILSDLGMGMALGWQLDTPEDIGMEELDSLFEGY